MIDIVVLVACTLCGYVIGKYFEKQIRIKSAFFFDVNKYLSLFEVNIDGRQLEIDEFNKEFAENCSAAFLEYLGSGKTKCRLSTIEKKELKLLFDSFEAVSSQELKKQISFQRYFFTEQNNRYSEQASKASIYPKLGILLGVMVGIVLI